MAQLLKNVSDAKSILNGAKVALANAESVLSMITNHPTMSTPNNIKIAETGVNEARTALSKAEEALYRANADSTLVEEEQLEDQTRWAKIDHDKMAYEAAMVAWSEANSKLTEVKQAVHSTSSLVEAATNELNDAEAAWKAAAKNIEDLL